MNQTYLNSTKNTVLSLKPSRAIRLLLMVLFVCITPLVSFGQTETLDPRLTNWTCPTGVTSITVEAWGAGGGGKSGGGGGADGGGGGGYAKSTFSVTPGFTYDYIVGAGGSANNSGENSSFESTLLEASGGISGGAGGTGKSGAGIVTFNGGNGGNNSSASIKGGAGGGSAAGRNQNGNNGIDATGDLGSNGGAAISGGGAGGNGGKDGVKGSNGGNPGGGGGGGGKQDKGGTGGNGQVLLQYITVTGITPSPVCIGSTITITGKNFAVGASTVSINGIACTSVTRASQTSITAVIAAGTTTGKVLITNPNGTNNGINLTVNALPTITTAATPAVVIAVCKSLSAQTTTMAYTATSGTPTSYSIDWSTLTDQVTTAFAFTAGVGNISGITVPANAAAGTHTGVMTITNANGCNASKTVTLIVYPTPVGGGVYSGNTPICINSSTGNMTLGGGYLGSVVRWEKRLLPSATWINITNTSTVYSESPSVAGTWEYRAVVGSAGCATVNSLAFTVVVNPTLTITLTSDNISVCQGTYNPLISYISTTGNPQGYVLDFGATANSAGIQDQNGNLNIAPDSIKINYMPSNIPIGIYNGNLTVITYYPSCSSVVYPISITVTAPPVVPSLGTPTQPNCKTPTGTVNVTLPMPAAGITYTITGISPVVAAVTNAIGVFSGLAAGSYNVTTSNGSCTSSPVAEVIKTFSAVTNTWNGTVWSEPGKPNSNQKLVFAGDYPPAADPNVDIVGCSCLVSGRSKVTIKSGRTLTITKEVTVVGGGSGAGSLIFENNASLVQINDTDENSGNIEYQRSTSTPVLKTDYVYWSSPVLGLSLEELSKETANGTFYSFDTDTEDWSPALGDRTMDVGKGYIVRRPDFDSAGNTVITEAYTANFKGQPNNGIKTIPGGWSGAAEGTSNLLGNPYPSALDADKFLTENKNVLDGTLYFWTHNTQIGIGVSNPGTGVFAYSSDDYASYNFTGGVGTLPDTRTATGNLPGGIPANEIKANKPSGKIASGQGFFATSIKAGNVTFTNEMRVAGTSGNNSQFFKTKDLKGKTANTFEKNRIWLNLTNTEGAFKQTLIGYVTDATNDYDSRFDGESFDANEFVDFYSVYEDKNLVIQGRALPFEETDEVQLGFRTTIDGNFTINIDQVDGSMTDQAVFIEDKLTNTIFNLKTGNYTFSTAPGTFNDRFVLSYNNKTLGTKNFDYPANKVLVSNANKQIKINSFAETIDKVVIYDLLGRQIYQKTNVNSNELSISSVVSSRQVVIVKALLQNGQEVSKKIIY